MTPSDCKLQSSGEDPGAKLLPLVARAVKLSQELPAVNTPAYIYYNDFPQYKAITNGQSKKILSIVQNVIDLLDAKTNVLDIPNVKTPREKLSSIVDANDRLLERLSMAMDLEEDPGRKTAQSVSNNLVVAVRKNQTTSIGWLKTETKSSENDVLNTQDQTEGEGLLKLLTSTTIRRPQTLFSIPPDNSTAPFRPNLPNKPNCIRPLSESIHTDVGENEEFPHPYEAELDLFAHSLGSWKPLLPEEHPVKPLDPDFKFVDTVTALDDALSEIVKYKEVSVDLEHHSHRSYLGLTCLIQLSTRDKDYILDALALRDHLYKLNVIFTDPKIVKVFHGSDMDLMWLQRDFSVYVVNLFDTGLAARTLQLGRFSLSFLLQKYVNVRANKKYQLADWRIRPLPDELIEYARTDTHYLLHVAAVMCQQLQDRGLLDVVLEGGRQLCLKRYTKPVLDPLGYLSLYKQAAGMSFTHRQLYALEQLYSLRDSIARREDESIHYVLPNHMLKTIAEVLPRESSGLFACCNPIPPLVRKYVHDLHKIIVDARNRPTSELPLTPFPETINNAAVLNQRDTSQTEEDSSHDAAPLFAPPHDFSRNNNLTFKDDMKIDEVSQSNPSPLGKAFSNRNTNSKTSPQSFHLLDPNRLLLKELSRLLSLSLVKVAKAPTNEATGPPATPVPDVSAAVTQNTVEPIIKLELTSASKRINQSTGSKSDEPNVTQKARSTVRVGASGSTQPGQDSDEVVILREEMPKRNKRNARRRKGNQSAEVASFQNSTSGDSALSQPSVEVDEPHEETSSRKRTRKQGRSSYAKVPRGGKKH